MDRPRPPLPPPRPDLEENSNEIEQPLPPMVVPIPNVTQGPSAGSKRGPPPIPSRPDLGEEVVPVVHDAPPKKVPPSVPIKKKSGSIKSRGRPEITILSAQPMGSVIPPPALPSQSKPAPAAQPILPPLPEPKPTPTAPSPEAMNVDHTQPLLLPPPPKHPRASQDAPAPTKPTPTAAAVSEAMADDHTQQPLLPPPRHLRATSQDASASTNPTPTGTVIAVSEAVTVDHTQPPLLPPPKHPRASQDVPAPTQPMPSPAAQQASPTPTPNVPSKTEGDAPLRPSRKSKGRTPPQRPKSKPVCDLPMLGDLNNTSNGLLQPMMPVPAEGDGGQADPPIPLESFDKKYDSTATEKLPRTDTTEAHGADMSAPVRTKPRPTVIKPVKSVTKDSSMIGIDASNIGEESEDVMDCEPQEDHVELKKPRPTPTVIRSKPNGHEEHKSELKSKIGQDHSEKMDVDLTSAVSTLKRESDQNISEERTTAEKPHGPEGRAKPPPPAKKPKPGVSAKPKVDKKVFHHESTSEIRTGTDNKNIIPKVDSPPAKTPQPKVDSQQPKVDSPPTVDSPPMKPKAKPTDIIPPKRKAVGSSTFYVEDQEAERKAPKPTAKQKAKPTVIVPKSRKVVGASQEAVEHKEGGSKTELKHSTSDVSKSDTPPAKRKTKPTVIMSKKGPASSKEKVEADQSETKAQSANVSDELRPENDGKDEIKNSTKPRKEARIIRPKKKEHKEKSRHSNEGVKFQKGTEAVTMDQDDSQKTVVHVDANRGSPEGESVEQPDASATLPKRKAPPRPGPPRPGPARPAPPKPSTKTEPVKHKEESHGGKSRARPKPPNPFTTEEHMDSPPVASAVGSGDHVKPPRPATIGKEKDDTEIREPDDRTSSTSPPKGKRLRPNAPGPKTIKPEPVSTVISSVQATKIEPSAIALYDYDSGNHGDLAFQAGDEIVLVQRVDKEWYIGRLGDAEGMMPLSLVEIIEDLAPDPTKISTDVDALYAFTGESDEELTILVGDTIQLLEYINDDWLKGKLLGKTGIFPASYVEVSPELKSMLLENKNKDNAPVVEAKVEDKPRKVSTISSGPRCRGLFDYPGETADDLSFGKDDIIRIKERISADWMKGELHGVIGMFPAAYVEVVEDLPDVTTEAPENKIKGNVDPSQPPTFPVTTALFDYAGDVAGDLSFSQGDRITVLGRVGNDWFEGEVEGKKGIFPASFVEHVEVPQDGTKPSKPSYRKLQEDLLPRAKALHDFEGEEDDELTFKTGDIISLLSRVNEEWMDGELNNKVGRFPVAFVEILVSLP